eukprot:TRINITY_DN12844_c0_g1_i1.p1 TRINITY_DN12844_c0_g1~~TRINITY_DN12844_c0_g1_i1.p1  ORF type:complete len:654 (+),score=118.57 TRINITY_DN12844_c0_g1_i1:1514-3475(+)
METGEQLEAPAAASPVGNNVRLMMGALEERRLSQQAISKHNMSLSQSEKQPVRRTFSLASGMVRARKKQKQEVPVKVWDSPSEILTIATIKKRGIIAAAGNSPYHVHICQTLKTDEISRCVTCLSWIGGAKSNKTGITVTEANLLRGHKGPITSLLTSLDSRESLLFSSGVDGNCIVWDTYRWKKKCVLTNPFLDYCRFENYSLAAFEDHHNSVVVSSADRVIREWDIEKESEVTKCEGQIALKLATARGKLLFSGDKDGSIKLWDLRMRGKQVGNIGGTAAHGAQISCLQYNSDKDLLLSSGFDCLAKSWSEPARNPSIPDVIFEGHRGIIKGIEVSSGYMYSCSVNRTIRAWLIETGENTSTVLIKNYPNCIKLFDDDKLALASQDKVLSIWNCTKTRRAASGRAECITDPRVLEAAGMKYKTYVVARTDRDGRGNRFIRHRAGEEDLQSIGGVLLKQLRTREEERGKRSAPSLKGSMKKGSKSGAVKASGTSTVSFMLPDEHRNGESAEDWRRKWEEEHKKVFRTQDALKEARYAAAKLKSQLNDMMSKAPHSLEDSMRSPLTGTTKTLQHAINFGASRECLDDDDVSSGSGTEPTTGATPTLLQVSAFGSGVHNLASSNSSYTPSIILTPDNCDVEPDNDTSIPTITVQ